MTAFISYLKIKHEHEIGKRAEQAKRDAYLFGSLRAMLTVPYGGYYAKYPKWHEFAYGEKNTHEKGDCDYGEQDVVDMFRGKGKLAQK